MRGLLIVSIVLSIGMGSTVIQVIAWATMLPAQLAETGSVKQAVSNTFDGKHACSMCKIAEAQREAEQQGQLPAQGQKKGAAKSIDLQRYQIASLQVYPPSGDLIPVRREQERAQRVTTLPDVPPPDLFV